MNFSSGKNTNADAKMNAAMLLERGIDFYEHGDYQAARRDFKNILGLSPTVEIEKKAREMLRRTGIDPVEIVVGVAVLLLLIFLFVYFGLHH